MKDWLPGKEVMCHRCSFDKSCRTLVVDGACTRWKQIVGENANTGEIINQWDCIDNHSMWILMSIGKETRDAGAATESLRNVIASQIDDDMDHLPPSEPMKRLA